MRLSIWPARPAGDVVLTARSAIVLTRRRVAPLDDFEVNTRETTPHACEDRDRQVSPRARPRGLLARLDRRGRRRPGRRAIDAEGRDPPRTGWRTDRPGGARRRCYRPDLLLDGVPDLELVQPDVRRAHGPIRRQTPQVDRDLHGPRSERCRGAYACPRLQVEVEDRARSARRLCEEDRCDHDPRGVRPRFPG